MKLTKPVKILIGILTGLPFIYMIFFMGFFFFTFFSAFSDASSGKHFFDLFKVVFVLHFLMMLLLFGLLAFYVVYLFKTDRIPADKKTLWAIVLFLGGMFGMPVFWYLYIWREPNAPPVAE